MVDIQVIEKIRNNIEAEPYAKLFGIKVLKLEEGHSVVFMKVKKNYNNIFGISHGGAVFSVLDVAFGSAVNSHGTVAVALNVNVNYVKPAIEGDELTAEATEISRSGKIAICNIIVKNKPGSIIATAQALAYLKKDKLPFL